MGNLNLEYYERYYFANGTECPYLVKDGQYVLHIKPVLLKMYAFYHDNVYILTLDKNNTDDPKIISMTYLQYLIDIVFNDDKDGELYQQSLVTILSLSLGDDYKYAVGKDVETHRAFLAIKDKDNQVLCKVSPTDFEKISKIILCYNNKDYDSRYVSRDLQDVLERQAKIQQRSANYYNPTMEEKKVYMMYKSGMSLDTLNNMTIRHFEMMYNSCVATDLYFSQRILQASEKYKVENLTYPLFKQKETKFSVLQNASSFEKKLESMTH